MSGIRVIDSHTEGEPTRVVLDGGPDLGSGSLEERLDRFAEHHDGFRRSVILEPRGSEAMVGALLCAPLDDDCATGVIFFNNAGYLGMCGHGAIGVAVTLAYLGRVKSGDIRIETPVGVVGVTLTAANEATVENVASYCYRRDLALEVPELGEVHGDVAWGGNWFFLVDGAPCKLTLDNEPDLTRAALSIKKALATAGVTGADGAEIDHIEFFGPPAAGDAHSRNFVLCPGNTYDRSPCGTGTSAKLACLAESGELAAGERWVQESVIGSRFVASYRRNSEGEIIPSVSGRAYICAESTLVRQAGDPFVDGIT
ncbi:MAG: proline racemase family protein [Pseudomonadota bacterium]